MNFILKKMGFIQFVFDSQIFNPSDFSIYVVDKNENEYLINELKPGEINIDDKYFDGNYSLKLHSKGMGGPKFFSSKLINNNYYRLTYMSKRFFWGNEEYYFLI